jgi:formiminotetrahydrofolate cyclodeaminase
MAAATRVLDAAVNIAPRCNPWLLSDLLVCGDLCVAAVRAGRYNVIANAGTEKQHAASLAEADRMLAECVANVQKLAGHATK